MTSEPRPSVVVVGGGLAGLVAGLRAAELGARVTVLEQGEGPAYLCNSRIATGVFNLGHADPTMDPGALTEEIVADVEGHGDRAIAEALASAAGPAFAWLSTRGAAFQRREMQGKPSWVLQPFRTLRPGLDWENRGCDLLLRALAERLEAAGGRLALGHRARRLTMEGGACLGIVAEAAGREVVVPADAVVIADGGFQGAPTLLRRYVTEKPEALVLRAADTARGDGLAMAEAAGARLVDLDAFYGHLQARPALQGAAIWPYPTLDTLSGAGILVDEAGRRFVDEGSGGILLSNVIARRADPLSACAVFDDATWRTTGLEEPVAPNPTLLETPGAILQARTLAELAAAIGAPAPALAATVEGYNAALREGQPDRLDPPRTPGRRFGSHRASGRRVEPRPIETPPFYAAPLVVGISVTLGGILVDRHARVLSAAGGPIPGLYAAGSAAAGLQGGPAAGYVGGLSHAVCLGFIAAEGAARRETAP